jgi:hypothetical protein
MRKPLIATAVLLAAFSAPGAGKADDTGAVSGAVAGAVVGGPIGAVIGAGLGALWPEPLQAQTRMPVCSRSTGLPTWIGGPAVRSRGAGAAGDRKRDRDHLCQRPSREHQMPQRGGQVT